MLHRSLRPFVASLVLLLATAVSHADLRQYVQQPDNTYEFKIVQQHKLSPVTAYIVELTSQTWQGIKWRHNLSILVPDNLETTDRAVLLIAGGSNGRAPKVDSKEARILAAAAAQCGAITAVLEQVPNQPLFDGRKEDALIAYTFDHYLNGEDASWPLLLPMVKSAVRAMDTIQAVAREQRQVDIEQFVVTGASKRGWTTWLTAAVDPRVAGIVPMVIDMLNLEPQLEQQLLSYGTTSDQVKDYAQINFFERMKTAQGQLLVQMVDPYSYRDLITMPKLVILGTNDPYWTVDAANLYFAGLQGAKALHYVPNAGHGLNLTVVPTLLAAFRYMTRGQPLPTLDWQLQDDDKLAVTWDQPGGSAILWQAHSQDRDFRDDQWTAQPLSGAERCEVALQTPTEGWTASYVEVKFPGASPLSLTTAITVLPETFPEQARR